MNSVDYIIMAIQLLGGLGMFLYGINVMGDGLEKVAGDKMASIIESLTSNLFKGVLVGAVVTALIQSSGATTVMVVGFVNAGIMTLPQAAGVIMGANIGTTVTAQILRLGDLQGASTLLEFLKPTTLAPLAIILGLILMVSAKKDKMKEAGSIVLGFGLLFIGMDTMSASVSSLGELEWFRNLFVKFENPVAGILAGTGVTALIQSSSGSVGILQAVASAGMVTFASALPIIMGQNIGSCVTALMSSIGASKNAKKAAMIHLYFNITGTVVCTVVLYTAHAFVDIPFWNTTMTRGNIADVHTCFNIICVLMLLPFSKLLIYLANLTVGNRGEEVTPAKVGALDKRFLTTPAVAIGQCHNEAITMMRLAIENLTLAKNAMVNNNEKDAKKIAKNEDTIDELEVQLNNYLVLITDRDLTETESKVVSGLFHAITDIERIGDHCNNIAGLALDNIKRGSLFSDKAKQELNAMFDATLEILNITFQAYQEDNLELIRKVEPLEKVIDKFNVMLKKKHISRLKQQECSVRSGVNFLEAINNLERVSDHCSNIATTIAQKHSSVDEFDMHGYTREATERGGAEFEADYQYYEEKFYAPIA